MRKYNTPVYEDDYDDHIEELYELWDEDPTRLIHMEKLADAFFDNLQLSNSEYGAWGVDCKRPFGNSFVEGDIAQIIGLELPEDNECEEYQGMIDYIGFLWSDLGVFLRYKWRGYR